MPSPPPNPLACALLCVIAVLALSGLAWACYDGLNGNGPEMSRGIAMILAAAALAWIGSWFFKGDDDA